MSASVSFFISMTGSLITSGKPASYSGSAVTEVCSSSQEAIDAIEPYCNGKFPPAATASQVTDWLPLITERRRLSDRLALIATDRC